MKVSSEFPFGKALFDACMQYGRLCAGIDPHAKLLRAWGLDDSIVGLERFTAICVEAFAGRVAVVKPQVAFYESFGSSGFKILEEAIEELRHKGTLVIADAKRGDIGSTNQGYADAWLSEQSLLACDALTVSPYLGVSALEPLFAAAEETGKGLFVLARTSNPEGAEIQSALVQPANTINDKSKQITVAQSIVDYIAEKNAGQRAKFGIGSYGVVVGATVKQPPFLVDLCGPVLMPGVGAQGATAADIRRIVGDSGTLGIPNVSRAILSAGPEIESLTAVLQQFNKDYLD